MKVVYLPGPKSPLEIREIQDPQPGADQILIAIHYAGLNHRDLWMKLGQYGGKKEDLVLGSDGSGIVKEVGSAVDKKWIGKKVFVHAAQDWGPDKNAQGKQFTILGNPRQGTFAEYLAIEAQYVYEIPAYLDLKNAAAIPLAGVTAFRALFTRARLKPGQKVLIRGVGAGTALFALQFAIAENCAVYVTSGQDHKIDQAIALGAKGGVNYKNENWSTTLQEMAGQFDVIVDSAAGSEFGKLIELCNPGGTIVNFGGTAGAITNITAQRIYWKQLNILGTTMGNNEDFQNMLGFLERKKLEPIIDKVFPMSHAEDAFKRMEKSEQFGKILLEIKS
ncbi:MAG: alcohol dehydrogenase [Bacteroidetes bacterium]|nr:MAG: alcohol dehydrogenase [Bacteroidota bacterium]